MSQEGFFTRVEAKGALPKRSDLTGPKEVDVETLHKLGLRGVRNLNPDARNPNMAPSVKRSARVYVLGEAPKEAEDKRGLPLVGPALDLFQKASDGKPTSWDNICRTRLPDDRVPEWHEIECFRPSVIESIQQAAPKVIIGLGNLVLAWALPGISGGILAARGRYFPIQIGSHVCWYFAVHHPEYINRILSEEKRIENVPAEEWKKAFIRDVKAAYALADDSSLEPEIHTALDAVDGVQLLTKEKDIIDALEEWGNEKSFAIDLETPGQRPPFGKEARILTVALGRYDRAVAFPLSHSQSGFSREILTRILAALRRLLTGNRRVIAHNLAFDLEWLTYVLGPSVLRGSRWYDTMSAAFILDERVGAQNLDYMCRLCVGLPLKSISKLNRNRLDYEPLDKVLRYNGMDAKYTHRVFTFVESHIKAQGLKEPLVQQIRRIPTVVGSQLKGAPVDVAAVREFEKQYAREGAEWEKKAAELPEVKEYIARFGSFTLASSAAVIKIFRDILHRKEGEPEKKGGKYSTDVSVLEGIQDEEPLAKYVLQSRRITKLKGTYIDRFLPEAKDTYLYPDGRVHTRYNTTFTDTGRLSSDDPNLQNEPKRKDKIIRKRIVASDGHVLIAADYGQIEARVIAMASQDKTFCEALWKDYDVHLHWAESIIDVWPKVFKERGSDIKKFRGEVKNEFVFPFFFGSSWRSVGKSMSLPDHVAKQLSEDFWQDFAGVKRWQERLAKFYEKNFYVQTLTGRRRRGPLSYNMVINTPIQGTASDIVVDAMNRLSEQATVEEKPWLQAMLNIHDDLTFEVPIKKKDEALHDITTAMVNVPFDFVNVPISIEVESGPNWYDMKHVGVYRSDKAPKLGV